MKYNYTRRKSSETKIGGIGIGGTNPVRLQSMTNTSTMDTEGSVAQAMRIAAAGGEIVRLTTQGEREAANMAEIRKGLDEKGCNVPLVADVHFNPSAAFKALETCEKVRINPGNFVDPARTFKKLEFTDDEYSQELERLEQTFVPFLEKCKKYGRAIRLGVNHGSLSDRIMSRYGDTPEGMVESALEYLRICRKEGFNDVVISIKSSNVGVMVETVELLAGKMEEENMHFPLHLGVTEAGDGEDGRIKSAVGIGTLLGEGLGDTIRVSLTEDPEKEIPVAKKLRDYILSRENHKPIEEPKTLSPGRDRDKSVGIKGMEGINYPIVVGIDIDKIPNDWHTADADSVPEIYNDLNPVVVSTTNANIPGSIAAWIDRFREKGGKNPVILKVSYTDSELEDLQIKASADLGALLLKGYGSGIWIEAPIDREAINSLSLGILQAARLRISKTEYIACPSCGRTLFDLQKTLKEVKEATKEMKGLKIGVMGCIVNGPGEMADADYGYVGAGPGKVSLYKGKELIKRNIPSEQAIDELLTLIKSTSPKMD
ncbi:MAG: (E)-4-hydroxy-3-methylbut-2-enyl-diphosphate synthase [Muribaculaceae bacterium]|nr:(E)-4-hydroxy-3-methylbut-2-enyl-diphosphate synthase [Muribaculaceae bacterium]